MKQFGIALLGAFIALLCLTLASNNGYVLIGASGTILLYLLFFTRPGFAVALLVGWASGLELLSTHRFGTSLLLAMLIYGLYWLFSIKLRFTSSYVRFIVAMFLTLVLFPLAYYPLTGYFQRLLGLAILGFIVAIAAGALRRFTDRPAHALI